MTLEMPPRPRAAAALVAILLAAVAPPASATPPPPRAAQPSPTPASTPTRDSDTLRVLVWNIQRGANHFTDGPEKALALIRDVAPDVCLLQESYDIDGQRPTLGRWLAAQLGWNQHQGESPHLSVLTPLAMETTFFHEPWHALGARLRDAKGRTFVAYSIWIDYRAYTPHHLRDNPGATDAELLACETDGSDRFDQARAIIAHLDETGHLGADGAGPLPLLVGGDWNCPSHLDWTAEAAKVFRFRRPLPLPVSLAMAEAGFADAFRAVHPEAVRVPGITWSPLDRGTLARPETAERIDRLYVLDARSGSQLRPVRAEVLPRTLEDSSIPQADRRFPSDHGAVVIDLRWERGATTKATDASR
jgi:endonuclease/exonuclease/phosphatase family metal-dependent hydrolase